MKRRQVEFLSDEEKAARRYRARPFQGLTEDGEVVRFTHQIDLKEALDRGHVFPVDGAGRLDVSRVHDRFMDRALALKAKLKKGKAGA